VPGGGRSQMVVPSASAKLPCRQESLLGPYFSSIIFFVMVSVPTCIE
jgi:hypothetical protein